jgi:peptide chain release factor 1
MENKLQALTQELEEIELSLSDPSIFSSPNYPKLAKRKNFIENTLAISKKVALMKEQLIGAQSMIGGDKELDELAQIEIAELEESIQVTSELLNEALTPSDPNNDKDAIIEIRAGAGGDESSIFSGEIFRMYSRYAELHNFKIELINEKQISKDSYIVIRIYNMMDIFMKSEIMRHYWNIYKEQFKPILTSQYINERYGI